MTTTAPAERISLPRRMLRGLGRRVVRLRPSLIPRAYLPLVLACWAFTLVLAGLILLPGAMDQPDVSAGTGGDPMTGFFAPQPRRVLLLVAAAILAAGGAVIALLGPRVNHLADGRTARGARLMREIAIAALAGFPAFALAADRSWAAALWALGFLVVAEVVTHTPLATAPMASNPARTVLVPALTVALPWVVLIAAQFASGSGTWTWISLFWFGASFAAFSAFYSIARVAESRGRAMVFLFRNDVHPVLVVGIVLAAAGVLAVRLTVARDLFNPADASIWTPFVKQPMSWAVATAVAVLVCGIALRASHRPLARRGERRVVAAIAAIGTVDLIIALAVVLAGMVISAVSGAQWSSSDWVDAYPALQFYLVLALGVVFLVVPVFRGTAARAITLVSTLYLLPALGLIAFGDRLPLWVSAATSVQIALELVAAAFLLALWNLVRPRQRVAPSVIVRLSLVPVLALHAGPLLPAAWTGFGRVVIVLAVLAALLLFMPKVAADPRRHALDVVRASWLQLLVLVVYALAQPSLFEDATQSTLGVLWLSVTAMAALSFDTAGADTARAGTARAGTARADTASLRD
ncbi:MAG TPA: hypothetical protein VGO65_07085 [Pseudolysinimonas sp.]|nr:hypothetical protein [Pseudolysinimonas sp.]